MFFIMSNKRIKTGIVLGVMLTVSACATTGLNKSEIGAAAGSLAGAILGLAIDGNNPGRGAALGGLLGAAIGGLIGNDLDKRDQAALQAKIDEVSRSSKNRETVWKSEHSGKSAEISTQTPTRVEESVRIITEDDVDFEQSALDYATGQRQATAVTNIRSGPGKKYPVKGSLQKCQLVDVTAITKNGWYVITRDDIAIGYVNKKYLQKPEQCSGSSPLQPGTAQRESKPIFPRPVIEPNPINNQGKQVTESKPTFPQSAIEPPVPQTKGTKEEDVRIARTCREVKIKIRDANGNVKEETGTSCQNAAGSYGA